MSNSEPPVKKQFIAGAACPACEAIDTIRMWKQEGEQHRDCVQCGFADKLNAQGNSIPLELPTRVNQEGKEKPASKSKTMQFFPNPKLKSKGNL